MSPIIERQLTESDATRIESDPSGLMLDVIRRLSSIHDVVGRLAPSSTVESPPDSYDDEAPPDDDVIIIGWSKSIQVQLGKFVYLKKNSVAVSDRDGLMATHIVVGIETGRLTLRVAAARCVCLLDGKRGDDDSSRRIYLGSNGFGTLKPPDPIGDDTATPAVAPTRWMQNLGVTDGGTAGLVVADIAISPTVNLI